MKLRMLFHCLLALICTAVVPQTAGASPAPAAAAQIISVRRSGSNLLVSVRIPKGHRVAFLETKATADAGAWVPRAVTRASGKVVFRVSATLDGQAMRVRSEVAEQLPKSYFRSKRTFASRRSTVWRPDVGRGEVFSLGADGSLGANVTPPASGSASRTIVESDIWKIRGNTLYFFNQLRGLQVLDISNPDSPVLRGTLAMPAAGEELYVLEGNRVVLLTRGSCGGGSGDLVQVVDASDATLRVIATVAVEGSVQGSRMVGSVLYLASVAYRGAAGGQVWQPGTVITPIDLAVPGSPQVRPTLWYAGSANAVLATDSRLFVATREEANWPAMTSRVHIIDIGRPDGSISELGSLGIQGTIADKFKMNLAEDVFSVISERWQDGSGGGPGGWHTTLETFSLAQAGDPSRLGLLTLAQGERLFATRFDANRAYIVTFLRIDPLWVIDLSDPANPTIAGSVEVPGWSTYIHPLGNRLLAVGVETNRATLSLFDVADASRPGLMARVPLGDRYSWTEANATEKAVGVFPDIGLVLVPYEGDGANGWASRVQLVDLGDDTLKLGGVVEHRMQPRRATVHQDRVISISGRDFVSVDASDRSSPKVKADLELAWPVNRVIVAGDYLLEIEAGNGSSGAGAVLRVAHRSAPDRVLNRLELGAMPVVGSSCKGEVLYVLQRPSWSPGWDAVPGGWSVGSVVQTFDQTTEATLKCINVGSLPAAAIVGECSAKLTQTTLSGECQALWPKPGLLVWHSAGFNYWINPMVDGRVASPGVMAGQGGAPAPGAASGAFAGMPYWRPWWNSSGVSLVSFDVSQSESPVLRSEFKFDQPAAWGFSVPMASEGLVFFSHQLSEQSSSANGEWKVADFLDVIDYADASLPTARPAVSAPGQLAGVTDQGALLTFVGPLSSVSQSDNLYRESAHACAYDGVSLYVVDSLTLPTTWPRPVVVSGRTIYLGRAASEGKTNHLVEAWNLSSGGNFGRRASAPVSAPIAALASFDGLLAGTDFGNGLFRFDVTDPAALRPLGASSLAGCLWFDLNRADGSLDLGLWVPLDDYGVVGF
jgi:hypothetical protein